MADEDMYQTLSDRIEHRERKAATYRAFVVLHAETRRTSSPTSRMKTQRLEQFDVSDH
jgi:hypothetical protein